MSQHAHQPRYTKGRQVWLTIIIVALGLALSTQAAGAKECHRETPLPADVYLSAPEAEMPEAMARFAGVWNGAWLDRGREALCHTLVVEQVFANGAVGVIYSIGTHEGRNIRLPNFWRATGRIVDGALRVLLPIPGRPEVAYRFAGGMLQGTFQGEGRVNLTRVLDVSQVGCRPQPGGLPSAPPATSPRDRLTATELLTPAEAGSGLVHNAYFLPVGPARPAVHAFKGTLRIEGARMFRARHGCPGLAEALPGFSIAFFTHGEYLVPVVRDIVPGTAVILSPGRVWSEPGDGGMSRASFPLTFTEDGASRNGLATFLYDDTRVSSLRFQVVQENVPWQDPFDGWGQASMTYTPSPIPHEEAVRAQFATELQQQAPIQPWSALPVSARARRLPNFDGNTTPAALKVSGVIVDGVLYLRGCDTRWGPYPYCREMRHGVFSVSKSLGAAVALLRLAQAYGDQVFALKIKDYVPVTATHDGWEQVTFADALNMATGIGDLAPQREPNEVHADENKPKMSQWHRARTAREKLAISFSYGRYAWRPGEVLRYNSTHTFVLAAAMDSFLKRQAGPRAHIWEMVVDEVFRPLGIFQAPMLHTQERDGGRGIPILANGLYLTLNDVAKLTDLLQHGGQQQGQQLLSPTRLAEALFQTQAMGLPTGRRNQYDEARYHLSFRSEPYRTATGCLFHIPVMAGLGGNVVVLLPNGISAFRFADGGYSEVDAMVRTGEAIRPFPCRLGTGETPPHAR